MLVLQVNAALLKSLVNDGFIPVISTVATDPATGQALNVTADTAAGEVAAALQVRGPSLSQHTHTQALCFTHRVPARRIAHVAPVCGQFWRCGGLVSWES